MSSYQTVAVVAYVPSGLATDYVTLAPGGTYSNGSFSPPGGGGTGPTGPSGATGPQGPQGDPGANGANGQDGRDATVLVTSRLSASYSGSTVTVDLSTTGVTAGSSYNSLTVDAFGRVTNAETVAGGSGAPTDVPYLTLGTDATLSDERVLSVSTGLVATDGGAGGTYTVAAFPYYSFCSLSADTGRTSLTLADSELSCPVLNGKMYQWNSHLVFRTQATTTGLRFGATVPAFTLLVGTGEVPVAAGGTGGVYHSYFTASGVSITGTGVALANVNYLARFFGTIIPSADGTLVVQHASEINASRVTLAAGSFLQVWQLTP